MQYDLIWIFIVVFAIDSIVPGPAVAMVMSRGASIGLLRSIPFIVGLVLGDLFLFLLAILGLAALAAAMGPLFFLVKWIGIVYLIYLAFTTWKMKPHEPDSVKVEGQGVRSFFLGLILPLANPRAVGFYAALLPAFLDVGTLTLCTALQFSIAIIIIWMSVLAFYCALADFGSRRFRNSPMQTWLNRAAAGAMVGTAGYLAFKE